MLSSLFRTCQRQPTRGPSFFTSRLRNYATAPLPKRGPRAVPASKTRPTAANVKDLHKLRRVELAEQLYNSGSTLLYNAGGRLRAYRIQCYSLGLLCFAAIYLNLDRELMDTENLKRRGIPSFVAGFYLAAGVFLIGAGNWAIYRARGQVQTVKLVKQLDHIFLEVTATTRIPFRSHRVLVRPYDMLVDPAVVRLNRVPHWMRARKLDESSPSATTASVLQNTAKAFSRFFFHIFSAARQFFQREGIVTINLLQPKAEANTTPTWESLELDLGGEYLIYTAPNKPDVEILFDLTTFKHPDQPDID